YGAHWAVARGTGRRRTGAAAFHATDIRREAGTAVARLVPRPQGTEAARRDAVVAVGGIPGRRRRRLWLQPFLRPLPRLVQDHLGHHAADARRRREAVRRLRWRHGCDIRRGGG